MEPAQTIIAKLGGVNAVSKITGVHRTRVFAWKRSRATGGTDGRIPQSHIETMIAFARENGIELSLADFFASEASAA
jgi:hypothetical protein